MRRRLHLLTADAAVARNVVDGLLLARVDKRRIHVLARPGTPMEGLPRARLRDRSALFGSLTRGGVIGGVLGLLAGWVALTVAVVDLGIGPGLIVVTGLIGVVLGAWLAGMIGVSEPNRRVRRYQDEIDAGKVLMMVDLPDSDITATEEMLKGRYPGIDVIGADPHTPAFP